MDRIEKHSSVSAYIASIGTTVFGGLTLQSVALVVGIVCTLGTFIVNWYYKVKENDREERRHAAKN